MSSNYLPQGMGYGPPETSLRPVFAQPWRDASGTPDDHANRSESVNLPMDDYAALLIGRQRQDGTGVSNHVEARVRHVVDWSEHRHAPNAAEFQGHVRPQDIAH